MLNTQSGRASAAAIGPVPMAFGTPHGAISGPDREQAIGLYRGLFPGLSQEADFKAVLNLKGGYVAIIHSAELGDSQLNMTVGKAFQFEFTAWNQITQAPADVTAWAKFWFMAKLRQSDPDSSAVITKTLGAGITVIDAANGLVLVQIAAADTTSLLNLRTVLFAQLQGLDGNGNPFDLWEGALVLSPAVIVASS